MSARIAKRRKNSCLLAILVVLPSFLSLRARSATETETETETDDTHKTAEQKKKKIGPCFHLLFSVTQSVLVLFCLLLLLLPSLLCLAMDTWYKNLPIVTKFWLTGCVAVTLLVQINAISPTLLYINYKAVANQYQLWRVVSTFFYFGKLDINLLFHLYFL